MSYYDKEYLDEHPNERMYPLESDEVKQIFSDAIDLLKMAYIYVERIDRYIAMDDGEDSLIRRLNEELSELDKSNSK